MELKIPIEIVFDDVNSVMDDLGKLQKYKLGEGDDMTLVDVDDVADVLTRHVMAREAKEPCGTKEGYKHDLVGVVRCKDCIYFDKYTDCIEKYQWDGFCAVWARTTYENWYCSRAERRSDDSV